MPSDPGDGTTVEELQFLTLADVVEIHRDQIARYGGRSGIRDLQTLLSALAVPQATFDGNYLHADLFEMAAAYGFHLCQNHPFVDGNKRTALACALVFLEMNGISVDDPRAALYGAMLSIATGTLGKGELARLLRQLSQQNPREGRP
ncbi:MAG: type II toxin-antitoxin system death-on-curing family toxin [Bacillota bacterium]